MSLMQKANRQTEVDDKYAEDYLAIGWDEIDKKGKVIKSGAGGKDISEYKAKISALEKTVAEQAKTIEGLTGGNEKVGGGHG